MTAIEKTLHASMYSFLLLRLDEVQHEVERLRHSFKLNMDKWTKGRLEYEKHKASTIRWLMATIPKRFHDVVTFTNSDLQEVESMIVRNAKDVF